MLPATVACVFHIERKVRVSDFDRAKMLGSPFEIAVCNSNTRPTAIKRNRGVQYVGNMREVHQQVEVSQPISVDRSGKKSVGIGDLRLGQEASSNRIISSMGRWRCRIILRGFCLPAEGYKMPGIA